jgi:hypothetical protein
MGDCMTRPITQRRAGCVSLIWMAGLALALGSATARADDDRRVRYFDGARAWTGLNFSLRDAVWKIGLDVYASAAASSLDDGTLELGFVDARVRFPLLRSDGKPGNTQLMNARFSPVTLWLSDRRLEVHLGSIMQRRLGPLGTFLGLEPLMVTARESFRIGTDVEWPCHLLLSVAGGRLTATEASFVSLIVDDTDSLENATSAALTTGYVSVEGYAGVRFRRRATISLYGLFRGAGLFGSTSAAVTTVGIDARWHLGPHFELFGIVSQDHDEYFVKTQGSVIFVSWFRLGLEGRL